MRDGGKGDTPRPLGVSMEVFDRNFDLIFGKKEKTNEELSRLRSQTQDDADKNGKPTKDDVFSANHWARKDLW